MLTRILNYQKKINHKNIRYIFAATLKNNLQPITARINKDEKERVSLEISFNEYTSKKTWDETIRRYLYEYLKIDFLYWKKKYIITKDGKIKTLKAMSHHEHIEYIEDGRHVTDANILYAIPQFVWENFLAELPHQDIVRQLNLSEHRHLWVAYNYAISADDTKTRNYRIDACSKYHFLASNYSDPYKLWSMIIDNGVIAQGKTVANAASKFPYVTPLYLEKFSHCPDLDVFHRIGDWYVLEKSKNANDEINPIKLNEIIAALPSSKKDPEKFLEMIYADDKMRSSRFAIKAQANLFYDVRNNFSLFKTFNKDLISDYCNAIINDLFFPEVIRRLPESLSIIIDDDLTRFIKNKLFELFCIAQTENINIVKLNSLQERWHRNITVIASNKPESLFKYEWHPLLSEQKINDITFTCLTTPRQLKDEGEEMRHCVGGYSNQCMLDNTHIIKVKGLSGERSTIELKVDNNEISIKQNYGYRNRSPHRKITNATNILLSKIKNNEISLNSNRGRIIKPGVKINSVNLVYPYSLADEDVQETIYQAYRNAKVLPAFMIADNYKSMMKNNTIVESTLDKLSNIKQELQHTRMNELRQ